MPTENHQQAQQCYELLHALFMEFNDNAEHLEALHEMFISFVADYRRTDEAHQKIIATYTALRLVLKESEAIFSEQQS
nr:hypothetical protein [uncultured Flavobacterium sp.]